MTTIGVAPPPDHQRALPMHIPSYSYHHPSMQRVKLAAVKEGLYHPSLPTFRRMDMDTAAHRLPDEHCRTTTSATSSDFKRSTSSLFEHPDQALHSKHQTFERQENNCQIDRSGPSFIESCTATGKALHRYYTTPEELTKTRAEFSKFLDRCPERFQIRLPALTDNKDIQFEGYNVRYLRPEITSSWKYSLTQEPNLDQFGQRPTPANTYARHRDSHPVYKAWRP